MNILQIMSLLVTDREEGIEGDRSTVKVETLDGKAVKWTFEEPANLEKR